MSNPEFIEHVRGVLAKLPGAAIADRQMAYERPAHVEPILPTPPEPPFPRLLAPVGPDAPPDWPPKPGTGPPKGG